MPFKELCTMNAREKFVLEKLENLKTMSALCKEYGITRNTGYKWLKRFEKNGFEGLENKSKAPRSSPLKIDPEIALEVVKIRIRHNFGAPKIHALLKREIGDKTPSERTISRVLYAAGLIVVKKRKKKVRILSSKPKIEFEKPNELWTIDFKGWWISAGDKIEPLTVRDAFSRMILEIEAVKDCSFKTIKPIIEGLFIKYGIPKAILTDNGPPFSVNGGRGITKISVWWASLGIEHIKTRPGKPCDNGAHERMHKDIADRVEPLKYLSKTQCQIELKRFMHNFNHHRPHQALGQKFPCDVYQTSKRKYISRPVLLTYPKNYMVLKVGVSGRIGFLAQRPYVSASLIGYEVGLEYESTSAFYRLFLGQIQLGFLIKTNGEKWRFVINIESEKAPHGGTLTG